ncbi:MAG: hypothetical protein HUU29_12650, partial [Planctomycetaceae bacterium]|nr:hypothetical protein [Planctomycetaceae bacterium]
YYKRWLPAIEQAPDTDALHDVIRASLKEFNASHLTIMRGDIYWRFARTEFANIKEMQYGIDIFKEGERYFVGDAMAGGPCFNAGIRAGDELVSIDGIPTEHSPALAVGLSDALFDVHYVIVPPLGDQPVRLALRKTPDANPVEVSVAPMPFNQIEATRNSVRVIEENGKRLGYVRVYHVLDPEIAKIVDQAIGKAFADVDALILDLRGSGGSPAVMSRLLAMVGNASQGGRGQPPKNIFKRGPVVGLIDKSSRSAKEVFAHIFQAKNLGTLVGEPTAGAVLGSQFDILADGTRVLLPMTDIGTELTGGVDLEGNPVKPDVAVKITRTYKQGRDDLVEAGIAEALRQLKDPSIKPAPDPSTVEEDFLLPLSD